MDYTGLQFIQTSAPGKARKKRETKNYMYEKTYMKNMREVGNGQETSADNTGHPSRLFFPTIRYKNRAVSHEIHGQVIHNRHSVLLERCSQN